MLLSRMRIGLAAGVAAVALLALPALAGANPGTGPELVQRSGRLVVLHADRYDGSSTRQWALVKGTDRVLVRIPDDVWIEPGTAVRLEGTMRNGALVVAGSLSAVQRTGPPLLAADPPPTAAAPSMERTAVILFGFTGGPTSSALGFDATDADTLMFGNPPGEPGSVDDYYREQTYDQIGFSGDVFGPIDITSSSATCSIPNDIYDWADEARAILHLDPTYEHFVYVFPDVAACQWAGLAEVGGPEVWINGSFQVPVLAHELGHNLGLAHAAGLRCTNGSATQVAMGSACSTSGFEYEDPFDAMGRSDPGTGPLVLRQMSMQHKLSLNLLPASAVQMVDASGTYQLAPMETLAGSTELLRIPKAGGGSYFVEFRQPIGQFDGQSPPLAGVYIRTESPEVAQGAANPNADTALIDMHPTTGPSGAPWADARMDVGQVFGDALRGILIQNVAEDATGATLSITMPVVVAPPVTNGGGSTGGASAPAAVTPTVPERPSTPAGVTAKLTKGGEVLLAWRGSAGALGISGYRVMRGGTVIATTSSTAYVDRTPRPGAGPDVTYSVVAVDVGGNVSLPGSAAPLRAALLRALGVSQLKVVRARAGMRRLVRVKGTVSDAQAVCRVRIAGGPWHPCKAKPTGAFAVSLQARGKKPVVLSLRDELGRVKLQTLRVR
jgi:hypothetical protein